MPLPGGMNTSTFTLASIRWHWIIYQSQSPTVHCLKTFSNSFITHFSAISVDVKWTSDDEGAELADDWDAI